MALCDHVTKYITFSNFRRTLKLDVTNFGTLLKCAILIPTGAAVCLCMQYPGCGVPVKLLRDHRKEPRVSLRDHIMYIEQNVLDT